MHLARRTLAMVPVALAVSSSALAQPAPPFRCGPDCSTPGQYVLCNDSFDGTSVSAGGVVLTDFLERACASFNAPAAQFQVTGFAGLFGMGDLLGLVVELYVESGTATPGTMIYNTGAEVQPSSSPGFSGLLFSPQAMTTRFRVCIEQQVDDPGANATTRPILYDADGIQGTNTMFIPSRAMWQSTTAPGDFILRAVVTYANLAPWGPGGSCRMDAGVTDAAPIDAGADASGVDASAGVDASTADAMGSAADGAAIDASSSDVGAMDGSVSLDAGGVDGSVAGGPPTLTAITPNSGVNNQAVEVTAVGTGFVPGLVLKIGAIAADHVSVPGPTTIHAQVPMGIQPGAYDVLVTNPDGESAILPKGYTVLGASGQAPRSGTCGCNEAHDARAPWMLPLSLLALAIIARSRRAARAASPAPDRSS
jgi:hypothetical protein